MPRHLGRVEVAPKLTNSPIVWTPIGICICSPWEVVIDVLPNPQKCAFFKEDGEAVINDRGERVGASKN